MQVWHENLDLEGPWYQHMGPNAGDIRKEIEHEFIDGIHTFISTNSKLNNWSILLQSINIVIPDSEENFGSWKMYAKSNIKIKLIKKIKNTYNIELVKLAMQILHDKMIPYVIHYLYKPNGIRFKKLKSNFLYLQKKE